MPDIVAQVLGPYGHPMAMDKLTRGYRRRPCTVQYHETDFNFISRLCEGECIYWFYEHQAGGHRVVFADDAAGSHSPLPGGQVIPFCSPPQRHPHHPPWPAAGERQEQHVFYWTMGREMEPDLSHLDPDTRGGAGACDGGCDGDCGFAYRGAAYCLCFFSGGFNGKKKHPPLPGPTLSSFFSSLGMDSLAGRGQQHAWGGGRPGDGGAWTGSGTGSDSSGESNRLRWPLESKRAVRHRTATVSAVRADAQLNKRSIAPGYTVVLRNHPQEDQNRQYLVVAVDYQLEENPPVRCSPGSPQAERSGRFELGTSVQRFAMEVHPTSVPYRPEVVTPRPQVLGPQLAVVVAVEAFTGSGPAHGGRVKVRFCEGADGDACALGRGEAGGCGCFALPQGGMAEGYTSGWAPVMVGGSSRGLSCRCAGADGPPGVGTQVVVEFLQGHPERPIVVGCLCDGEGVRTARG